MFKLKASPIDHLRHQGVFPTLAWDTRPITIIGAKDVGGWLALLLSGMVIYPAVIQVFEVDQVLVDHDLVRSGPYYKRQIGQASLTALQEVVYNKVFASKESFQADLTGQTIPEGQSVVVFKVNGVPDSRIDQLVGKLEGEVVFITEGTELERANLVKAISDYCPQVGLIIDIRLGEELGRLLVIDPLDRQDVDYYLEHSAKLPLDLPALPMACVGKRELAAVMMSVGRALFVLIDYARKELLNESSSVVESFIKDSLLDFRGFGIDSFGKSVDQITAKDLRLQMPASLSQTRILSQEVTDQEVAIVGVGALGSVLARAVCLSLGVPSFVSVYDFDNLLPHNVPNTAYRQYQAQGYSEAEGLVPKVNAFAEIIADEFSLAPNELPRTFCSRVDSVLGLHTESKTVFLMVDCMEARKDLVTYIARHCPQVEVVIEARMGDTTGRIYRLDPRQPAAVQAWLDCWYPNPQADPSVCRQDPTLPPAVAMVVGRTLLEYQEYLWLKNNAVAIDSFRELYLNFRALSLRLQ